MRGRFLVFDPSGTWMSRWNYQFAALEIPHLRSAAVHQPDPAPHALRTFAESRPNELFPPYDLQPQSISPTPLPMPFVPLPSLAPTSCFHPTTYRELNYFRTSARM